MARMDMPDMSKIINEMLSMGQKTGAVAEAMIDAAALVTKESWQQEAERRGYHASGEMFDSIGSPVLMKTAYALTRDIYPQGKDSKKVGNAAKAFYLHYGTSRIKASYWVDDAESAARQPAYQAEADIWEEFLETGKIPAASGSSGSGVTKRTK